MITAWSLISTWSDCFGNLINNLIRSRYFYTTVIRAFEPFPKRNRVTWQWKRYSHTVSLISIRILIVNGTYADMLRLALFVRESTLCTVYTDFWIIYIEISSNREIFYTEAALTSIPMISYENKWTTKNWPLAYTACYIDGMYFFEVIQTTQILLKLIPI